jgi:hypothetical protein
MYLAVSRTFGPMRRRLIYLAIAKLGLLGGSVCLGFGGWFDSDILHHPPYS